MEFKAEEIEKILKKRKNWVAVKKYKKKHPEKIVEVQKENYKKHKDKRLMRNNKNYQKFKYYKNLVNSIYFTITKDKTEMIIPIKEIKEALKEGWRIKSIDCGELMK